MTRILVVDDQPENAYFLEALFTASGFEVAVARHGEDALTLARDQQPALVIADLLMPAMDGFALLSCWKEDELLRKTPFVVYTATYSDTEDRRLALDLGADAFLTKPAEPEHILQTVVALLDAVTTPAPPSEGIEGIEGHRTTMATELRASYNSSLIRKLEHKTLQLESANEALRQEIADREIATRDKLRLTNELRSRVKELRLLNEAARLLRDDDSPLPVVLEQLAAFLPGALRYPERATVRLDFNEATCESPNFAQTEWMMRHEVELAGGAVGVIEVAYSGPSPDAERLPFVVEEREMVVSLGDMVRSFVDRRAAHAEREALADQLRQERADLLFAQEVANVGSWEAHLSDHELVWSEQTARVLEMRSTEPREARDAFFGLVHPDDRKELQTAIVQSRLFPGPRSIEHRLLMPDGRIKYVLERWHTDTADDGITQIARGTCQDITDRVVAEQETLRLSALLQAVANSTADALYVKDRDGRYLLHNGGAARNRDVPALDVLGRDDSALFSPQEAAAIMANDRRVMTSGKQLTFEETVMVAGSCRTYLSTKAPYRDAAGNTVGVVGISRDVTERNAAEELVRQSEERYRVTAAQLADVLDHSPDLICSFDENGRFVRVNAACNSILGYTPEELLGVSFREVLVPEDRDATQRARADTVAGQPPKNFENRCIRKDGGLRNIEWAARWSDDERTMFCVGRDVTEHKVLEAQFLRSQRMESIGTLAAGIAHDFNNILAPVMLAMDLLRFGVDDPVQLGVISTIERSIFRGAELVQQLMSFGRGVEPTSTRYQLSELIAEVERMLDETLLKSVSVRTDVADDLWPVTGDATQLHQVLMNLVVNARDAMSAGGVITIAAQNVLLDAHDPPSIGGKTPYVRMDVTDTGTGMEPAVLERAFEPFFTTKDVGKGTGLGLSTCHGIVRSHGGMITIDSELGRGTTISVFLPATSSATSDSPVTSAALRPRGHGQLVMVVDDEPALCETAGRILTRFGYRVLVAGGGSEAIDLFREQHSEIAAVITDMMMPEVDGVSMITALQQMRPDIPVLATSGATSTVLTEQAHRLGVQHLLAKPYTTDTLLNALHQLLTE